MKRILDIEQTNIIGGRIREARRAAKLSQEQLSEKLELMAVYTCRGSISRIENGKRMVSDIEIDALSKVLGGLAELFIQPRRIRTRESLVLNVMVACTNRTSPYRYLLCVRHLTVPQEKTCHMGRSFLHFYFYCPNSHRRQMAAHSRTQ